VFQAIADAHLAALPPMVDETNIAIEGINDAIATVDEAVNLLTNSEATLATMQALAASANGIAAIATYLNYESRGSVQTLQPGDRAKFIDLVSSITQPLSSAATLGAGWFCYVRNNSSGQVTIDPSGAQTINGSATLNIAPAEQWLLICNGTSFNALLINIKASTSPDINTVVKRDGSGYINASLINMTATNLGTAAPAKVAVEASPSDGYLRWQTLDNFRRYLDNAAHTGWLTNGFQLVAGKCYRHYIAAFGAISVNLPDFASTISGDMIAIFLTEIYTNTFDQYPLTILCPANARINNLALGESLVVDHPALFSLTLKCSFKDANNCYWVIV
jgi:hypothetical protein